MFTVCPKCTLTLIVTAADLRVGQGYVRCGRCSNVFNALVGLIGDAESQHSAPEPDPDPPAAAERSSGDSADRPARAGDASAAREDSAEDEDLEFDPTSTNVSDVFVEPKPEPAFAQAIGTGTFRTLALKDADAPPAGREPPDREAEGIDRDLRALALRLEAASKAADKGGVPEDSPPASSAADAAEASAAWLEANPVHRRLSRRETVSWSLAGALLLIVLAVQMVHHHRDSIATDPRFGPPLASVYSALGLKLFPRWDLSAYDVRQLGASADPNRPDVLVVRASILNRAMHAQPLPLLRVTVQNRYGTAVATRDVPAEAYAVHQAGSSMGAGQRIDAEVAFRDPGLEVVGFELDACLPRGNGALACGTAETAR